MVPARQSRDDASALLPRIEAGEHRALQRIAVEAGFHRVEVLPGQHGGRNEEGDLLAAHRREIARAQRHLGLAVAHVAADQAVHRLRPRQIAHHVGDRGDLTFGLLEREVRLELLEVGDPARVNTLRVCTARNASTSSSSRASSMIASRARLLVLAHAVPPSRASGGESLAAPVYFCTRLMRVTGR